VRNENGRFLISKGLDETKDQSYVLWGLQQDLLSRTLLPIGNYRKTAIRQMAHDLGYPELAKKSESYEICFVPDNDYRGFLKRRVDGLEEKLQGGNFIDRSGKIIGQHKGYPFYTGRTKKRAGYRTRKTSICNGNNSETNTVVLGEEPDLNRSEMTVAKLNLIKYDSITEGMEAIVKIRYKDKGSLATLHPEGNTVRGEVL
jgi:tRNA-specific 2-thiouridylase